MRELINDSLIWLDMAAASKEEAIEQLAGLMADDARLQDRAGYIQAVLERETSTSTAVGFQVAIPHGKSRFVSSPSVAFARLKDVLLWEGEEVRLVFLLAVPEEQAGTAHLKILAELSRKLMSGEFRSKLLWLGQKSDIVAHLNLGMG